MPSNFGPIVSSWTVEQAVRDTLKQWIDTFLSEEERQSNGRWGLREITRPRSWFIQSEFRDVPAKHLPAIHVESRTVQRDHADGGRVHGTYPMVVQCLVKGQSRELSRELLGVFEWAVTTILEKHGDLEGVASRVSVGDTNLDLVDGSREQTLLGFEVEIGVSVADIANRFGGPDSPDDPAPTPPPVTSPEDPEHTSTTVTVETLGSAQPDLEWFDGSEWEPLAGAQTANFGANGQQPFAEAPGGSVDMTGPFIDDGEG